MIRFVEGEALGAELMRLTASPGAAACRIGSLFLSYGGHDDIARFWLCFDEASDSESKKVSLAFSKARRAAGVSVRFAHPSQSPSATAPPEGEPRRRCAPLRLTKKLPLAKRGEAAPCLILWKMWQREALTERVSPRHRRHAAAVSLYGDCATVFVRDGYDLSELREFLRLLSPGCIVSDRIIFPDTPAAKTLSVMRLALPPAAKPRQEAVVLSGYCDIPCREIFDLLQRCRCEDIDPPPYEEFVSVLASFQKRGTPFCSFIRDSGRIVSFAMTASVTDTSAVIGSVCTSPDKRGQGMGSSAVLSLAAALGEREILVICDKERNGGFYRSLGFNELSSMYYY